MERPTLKQDPQGRTCISDVLGRGWLVLTPEEMVRQHFVAYLIEHKGYPAAWMANEVSLHTATGQLRRCDTVVFDRCRRPLVIIEYKAPHVVLGQSVFDQIVRYNAALRARYLMVTNGRTSYCCRVDYATRAVTYLPSIPAFSDL